MYLHSVAKRGLTFMRFLRVALLCILAVISLSSSAQSREHKVDEVLQRMSATDMPMTEREVLPRLAQQTAQNLLTAMGKSRNLGAEWKPGNSYWDRAQAAIVKGQGNLLKRKGPQELQQEANARELLEELSDADLDEIFRFYRSELYRKAMRSADAGMSMMFRTLELMNFRGTEKEGEQKLKELEKSLEQYKLTDEEQRQFDRAVESPAFRTIRRGAMSQFIGAMNDPSAFLSPQLAPETAREIARIIEEYQKTRPAPPPLAYNADFIADPAKERALRREAEAVLGGDVAALERLKTQAEKGDAIAEVELGRLLGMTEGGKNDRDAHEWTRRSAMQGLARAQYNLGVHYDNGIGVARDSKEAARWFAEAAAKGFARAQFALGQMHREGRSVERDQPRSAQLLRKAADQGLPGAQLAMAQSYDLGLGVEKDPARANEWLAKAVAQGSEAAKQYEAQRERFKAELLAALAKPAIPAAQAVKAELNRQLLAAVKRIDLDATRAALDAGADIATKDARPNEGESPLHHAARTGNVELAKLLVARSADVNAAAVGGFTPLHVAAGLNRRAAAQYLLEVGANPNAVERSGTPLHAATLQGHAAMVALLLERGANPNAKSPSGQSPLHTFGSVSTYYQTHTEILRLLADAGADLFASTGTGMYASTAFGGAIRHSEDFALAILQSKAKIDAKDPQAAALVPIVSGKGYLRALRLLEDRGLPLDARDGSGRSGLHAAAQAGKVDVADYLLAKGLQIDLRDGHGRTPIFGAVENGHAGMVSHLLDRGAAIDVRDAKGQTPLITAIYSWRTGEAARLLVRRNASLSIRNNEGLAPLDAAATVRDEDAARLLLESGAAINSADERGITALHRANSPAMAAYLIAKGADVNATDGEGNPPLFRVIRGPGGVDVAKVLLEHGAKPSARARDGSMLIHHAATAIPDAVELALSVGAGEVNLAAMDGRTPLHRAAEVGQRAVVEFLLKNGADINAVTASRDTALHFAVSAKAQWGAVEVLLKAGANAQAMNATGETPIDVARRSGNQVLIKALSGSPSALPDLPPLRSRESFRTRDR